MTNLNTLTINVNNETKTYTALTNGNQWDQFHTVSIKSIYDRILTAALAKIESNFNNLGETLTSDCGRFTFESGFKISRDNTNGRWDRVMSGASIKYQSRITDTQSDDNDGHVSNNGIRNHIAVEIAKDVVENGHGRTVYVLPESSSHFVTDWDRDADKDDVDCSLKYGVASAAHVRTDAKDKNIEVDGVTYYEEVYTYDYLRKARIDFNGRKFAFATPEELDAAIERISNMMADQKFIDAYGEIFDNEEARFNAWVEAKLQAEGRRNETEELNETIMSQIINMLDAAGFDKCEHWHRQPEKGQTGWYEIRMKKDTDMGICTVSVENFTRDSEYCYDTNQRIYRGHVADFGLSFGRGGSNGTSKTNSSDLLDKVETAIAMAELAG